MEGKWNETREWRGAQGERNLIVLGAIELVYLQKYDKIDHFIKLYYFSDVWQNEIKSFDRAIDQPIAELLLGEFCLVHKTCAAGPGERLQHGCVLF